MHTHIFIPQTYIHMYHPYPWHITHHIHTHHTRAYITLSIYTQNTTQHTCMYTTYTYMCPYTLHTHIQVTHMYTHHTHHPHAHTPYTYHTCSHSTCKYTHTTHMYHTCLYTPIQITPPYHIHTQLHHIHIPHIHHIHHIHTHATHHTPDHTTHTMHAHAEISSTSTHMTHTLTTTQHTWPHTQPINTDASRHKCVLLCPLAKVYSFGDQDSNIAEPGVVGQEVPIEPIVIDLRRVPAASIHWFLDPCTFPTGTQHHKGASDLMHTLRPREWCPTPSESAYQLPFSSEFSGFQGWLFLDGVTGDRVSVSHGSTPSFPSLWSGSPVGCCITWDVETVD